ncbi:hypothetical protein [Actinoplanes sp. DH11]|uniref:hypothetical protein n=1 Tax=Actinoplanes sp. DH11 TaxID=2857011 RepID=UPI001E38544C|nr:hypothetical protein [Actinoplanes sp. DH11]
MRRWLLIPLLLLVTACSAQPVPAPEAGETSAPAPSPSPAPEVTLPAGYIGASEASEPPPAGEAALRGAGWSLRPGPVQVGPLVRTLHPVVDLRTGEQTIGNYLIGYAMMRAPEGQEMVVVPLGDPADLPAVPVTIRAGDRSERITKLTAPIVVLTVLAGAPVSLTVEDGRPQTLDLRTGKRAGRPDTDLLYDTPRLAKTDGPSFGVPGSTGLFLSVEAELVPGVDGAGYARKGFAWLALTVEVGGAECDMRLARSSFRFETGGRSYRPAGGHRVDMSVAAGALALGTILVAIEVPEKTRRGTLVIEPAGSREGGSCGTGRLTTVPARDSMPVALS